MIAHPRMICRSAARLSLLAAMVICMVSVARAEDAKCGLLKMFDLPITASPANTMMISVTLGGKEARMQVDTGAYWSAIDPTFAGGLSPKKTRMYAVDAAGVKNNTAVTIPEFQIGILKLTDVDFYLLSTAPASMMLGGNLGANILGVGDLEIDPAHGRLAMFSHKHCPNQVIYWPHSDLIKIPMHTSKFGQVYFPVKLDGQEVRAVLDTGATASMLSANVAAARFDLHPGDAGMQANGSVQTFTKMLTAEKHQFKTLEIGDVRFRNPWIGIAENRSTDEEAVRFDRSEVPELLLGMHQIRMLHIFVDYADEVLYATSVDGDAQAAGASTTAPAVPTSAAASIAPSMSGTANGPEASLSAADLRIGDNFDYAKVKDTVERGLADLKQQHPDQAIAEFDKALAAVPRLPQVVLDRAQAYFAKGDTKQAFIDVNAVLSAEPANLDGYLMRGRFYVWLGDLPHAVADAKYVAAIAPHNGNALWWAGGLLLDANDPTGALADFDTAIKIMPMAQQFQLSRCRALIMLKQYGDAIIACDAAAPTMLFSPWPQVYRGFAELHQGKPDAAAADFDKALLVDSSFAPALYGRSLVEQQRGNTAAAAADLAAAKQQDRNIERYYASS